MAKISLAVSALSRYLSDADLSVAVAAGAFAPFGVELQPLPALALPDDPSATAQGWTVLLQQLRERSAQPGAAGLAHIVFADLGQGLDQSINGELMDRRRGICAIFMQCDSIRLAPAAERLNTIIQVCIHELGHLLNLTHGDADYDLSYVCSMRSFDDRSRQPPDAAWELALVDAAKRGEQVVAKPSPARYYPFGARCRANLREAAHDQRWWPWQSNFRGMFDEPRVREDRSVALAFLNGADPLSALVHDGLAFSLRIGARAPGGVAIPMHIGPEFGTLRVTIRQPGGDEVVFQPGAARCSGAQMTLRDNIIRSFSIIPDPKQVLFPVAGEYLCRVTFISTLGLAPETLASASIRVKVRASRRSLPARRAALRVVGSLRDGSARTLPQDVRRATNARGGSVVAQHAAYKLALIEARHAIRLDLLESCMQATVPAAIRHRAARRWALEQHVNGLEPDLIRERIRQWLPGEVDAELHETIQRMEDGWKLRT